MNANVKRSLGVGVLAVTVMLTVGFGSPGVYARVSNQGVALGGATAATVAIEMGAGRLDLSGAATAANVMDGEFQYSDDDWAPEVTYGVEGGEGQLAMRQGDGDGALGHWPWDDADDSQWNLRFTNAVPLSLAVKIGAGMNDFDLSALDLTDLDLEVGAGETTIDLTGVRQHDVNARIEGGAGLLNVKLPRDVGVRVVVENGIGEVDTDGLNRDGDVYVNDAYGTSPVTVKLDINLGVGNVDLEVVA